MTGRFGNCRRAGAIAAFGVAALLTQVGAAIAATATAPDLGTATSFAVLAGQTVTDSAPPSTLGGDLGVYPGTAITGNPSVSGSIHKGDDVARIAQADLKTAYDKAAGETPCTALPQGFGTVTAPLKPGIYCFTSAAILTGALTLDGAGVYVFQVPQDLTAETGSSVALTNGASACQIFWQVGNSATLKTGAVFQGTVMALTSISLGDSVTVQGRILARNGSVTLINDTITRPTCSAIVGSSPSPAASATVAPVSASASPSGSTPASPGPSTPASPGPSIADSPGPRLPEAGAGRHGQPNGPVLATLGLFVLLATAAAARRAAGRHRP
ncbi:MAG: hypothetical protein NVSMB17_07260 [Candidatus Dormibacteria bacterium]